jgi:hypothetical protein
MNVGGRCLRCGAPYEPDDTVCYTCGAPIGETQGNTQPVRAVKVARGSEPVPLADDGGTPEETAEREPAQGTAGNTAEEATAPPEVDISRITVGSMPAVRPAPVSAPRAKRRVWPLVLVACVVVLAALGGALYATRALNPPSPPVAHQTRYSDPNGRFHFVRPALWNISSSGESGVTLTDSSGASVVQIIVAAPGMGDVPQDATRYADQLAAAAGNGGQPLAAQTARTLAGAHWEQRVGPVTGSDGAVRRVLLLVTEHGGSLYAIRCTSPLASFEATDNLVFEPLLSSFTFDV